MNVNKILLTSLLFFALSFSVRGQLANITYTVSIDNMCSYENCCSGACWETGNEEYTAYVKFKDNVNGTLVSTGCLQTNYNGSVCYAGGTAIGTRTNTAAYTMTGNIDAWEDDQGSRCSYDGGCCNSDDCRRNGDVCSFDIREMGLPATGYYVSALCGSTNDHRASYRVSWQYAGTSNAITPSCAWQTAAYTAGFIRSWSVNLTAGRTYVFETCSQTAEDTYLRLYGSDGYTIVAFNDDGCGTQSTITYTPSATGWYYVENSLYTRSQLGSGGNLRYIDNTTPAVAGGTIATSQTICSGSPVALTNSADASGGFGSGGFTYQWESSPNNSTWTAVGSATATTYTTPSLTATTYYRRRATDCKGTIGYSNTVTITVNAAASGAAGSDISTCISSVGEVIAIPGATAADYSSVAWSYSGTGTGTVNSSTSLTGATFTTSSSTGSGTLTLTINGLTGCSNITRTRTLSWNLTPGATAGSAISQCMTAIGVGNNITMTGASMTGTGTTLTGTWTGGSGFGSWTQNTGSPASAFFTPSTTSGSFTATLTTAITGGSCNGQTSTSNRTITWNLTPTAAAGSNISGCTGTSAIPMTGATMTGTGTTVAGTWSGGTGTWSQNTSNPALATFTPSSISGSFTATLTVVVTGGACNGLTSTSTRTIAWSGVDGDAGGPLAGCGTENILTTGATASGSYSSIAWTYSAISGTGTLNNATSLTGAYIAPVTGSGSGTLTLTVSGTSPCGNIVDTRNVTWSSGPVADAGSDINQCVSGAITMTGAAGGGATGTPVWTGGSGSGNWSGSGLDPSTYVFTPSVSSGSFTATLTVTASGTCAGTATDTRVISWTSAPTASAGSAITTCTGTTAIAMTGATSTGTYSAVTWSGGGGSGSWTQNANPALAVFTPSTSSGSFTATLTVTGSGICAGTNPTSTRVISWGAVSVAAGSNLTNNCGTGVINMSGSTASGNYSALAWTGGGGLGTWSNTSTTDPTLWTFAPSVVSGSFTATLTATGNESCTGTNPTSTRTITWVQIPSVEAGTDINSCTGTTAIPMTGSSSAGTYSTVTWTGGGGLGTWSQNANPALATFTPSTTSGSFTAILTVTGSGACAGNNPTDSRTLSWGAISLTAGSAITSCGNTAINMTGSSASGNYTSVNWTGGSGQGTWSSTSGTDPSLWSFTPSTGSGSFTATLEAIGSAGCLGNNPTVTRSISWEAEPTANAGTDILVCSGTSALSLAGSSATGTYGSVSWANTSGYGNGSFTNGGTNPGAWSFTPSTAFGNLIVTLTVTGNGTCTGRNPTDTRIIRWSTTPTVSNVIETPNTSCNGEFGAIQIVAAGQGELQYSIDNGAIFGSLPDFGGLDDGVNYNVVVQDSIGCTASFASNPVVLAGPTPVVATIAVTTNVLCAGGIEGEMTITAASGGSGGPWEYSLGGSTGDRWYEFLTVPEVIDSLSAGTYLVSVRDAFGCPSIDYTLIVTEPSPITISSLNVVNVVGCGSTGTGSITASATGGTGTLNYYLNGSVNTPPTSGAWTGLPGGSYEVLVQDANACQTLTQTRINAPWTVNAGNDIYNCGTASTTLPGSIIGQLPSTCTTTLTCSSSCGMPGSTTSCTYRITLEDTWGDGWNGGSVSVIVNGTTVLNNVTLSSGYGPVNYTFTATDGQSIVVNYTAGSWSAENYYRVGRNSESYSFYSSTVGATPPASNTFTASCAYCAVASYDFTDERISNVSFNGASQASGASWYTNFSGSVFTTVDRGTAYSLNVSIALSGSYTEYIRAWFDWNRDGDFADAGENYLVFSGTTGPSTRSLSVTIPAGATLGETKMRIGLSYTSDMATDACGLNNSFGEYEDYRINIYDETTVAATPSYSWSPSGGTSLSGTVSPSSTTTYTLTVNDGCGCIQNDQLTVNVSGQTNATSQVNVNCFGNSNGCITLTPSNGIQPYLLYGPSSTVQVFGGSMKPITVNNTSGSSLTNHPVKMTIPYAAGMRADFGDIRFFDASQNKLSYWIESVSLSTQAVVWVKLASMATGNNALYMTYGNTSLTSESNGSSVFTFFDALDYYNTSKWSQGTIAATTGTLWSYYGGALVGGNNSRFQQSVQNFSGNYICESRIFETTAATSGFTSSGFFGSTANAFNILSHNGTTFARNDGAWPNFGAFSSSNQWVRDKVVANGASSSVSRTGETSGSVSASYSNSGLSAEYVRLGARGDNSVYDENFVAKWDWIFVRPYISTEPSITIGSLVTSDNEFCGFGIGAYNFNVVDVAGCNTPASATITQPAASIALSNTMTQVSCYGISNGAIDLTVTGGTPTYVYSWAGPSSYTASSQDITGLAIGNYSVTVADQNACSQSTVVTVSQQVPITAGYYTWKGITNTLWQIDNNWDCRVPGPTSAVIIPAAPIGGNNPLITGGVIGECLTIRIMGSVADLLKIDTSTGSKLQVNEP